MKRPGRPVLDRLMWFLHMIHCCTFIVFIATSTSIRAQSKLESINLDHVEYLSQRDGLSSNLVTDMVQDKQGYLWIGTEDGLNRYDGYNFKVFRRDASDSTSIQFNKIFHLAVDRQGNIWAGSTDGLISYFHPPTQKFVNYNWATAGLPGDGISKIFFDSDDNVWVTVNKHGLYRLDPKQNRFFHVSDLPDIHPIFKSGLHYTPTYNTIYDIYEDSYGMFWMATHDGLYLYNPLKSQFKAIREKNIEPFKWRNDCFTRILPSNDGFWLSAYGGGLTHYNVNTKKWQNFKYDTDAPETPTTNIIYEIGWRNSDELWICSIDRGWGVFNIKEKTFEFPELLYVTNRNVVISDMVIQPSGVIWFSSRLKGFFKYAPNVKTLVFHKVKVKHSDNGDSYRTLGFYHDEITEKLYYGTTLADGVHIRDLKSKEEKVLPFETHQEEPFMSVHQVLNDAYDTLWILTRDYVYTLNKKKETLELYHHQPITTKSPQYRDIIRSKSGDIWIASTRFGLFRINPRTGTIDNFIHDPLNPSSLSSNLVRKIVEDNNGNIWAATNNGLSVYNPKKKRFQHYSKSDKKFPLGSNNLTGLSKMPDGSIWVASADRGLYFYSDTNDSITFTHWGMTDGIPSEVIHSICVDPAGTLWAATPVALVSIQKDGLVKSYFPPLFVDGLASDNKGTIFMGAAGGYVEFNPKSVDTQKSTPPPLVINSFKYFDTEVPLWFDSSNTASVKLSYDKNFVSFDFAALDFTDPSKNRYSYFMEGTDKSWVNAGNRRYASYTNLSPGNYRFRLRAANHEGIWTDPGLTVNITITPPFWETWYFRLLAIVGISFGAFSFYKYRIEKILQEENLKSEYKKKISEIEMTALRAQMNPHFIFNSLNSINRYIVKADPETASLYLTKFSRLIRLILDNSKESRVILENELTAIRLYIEIEQIRFDNKFSYRIECKSQIDTQQIEIPPMILQPYIENAIWHGLMGRDAHGKLDILIDIQDGMLTCFIEDNGIGREKSKKAVTLTTRKKSYGMQITSNRLDLLNKESKVSSSVEVIDLKGDDGEATGTRVIVKMPVFMKNKLKSIVEPNF